MFTHCKILFLIQGNMFAPLEASIGVQKYEVRHLCTRWYAGINSPLFSYAMDVLYTRTYFCAKTCVYVHYIHEHCVLFVENVDWGAFSIYDGGWITRQVAANADTRLCLQRPQPVRRYASRSIEGIPIVTTQFWALATLKCKHKHNGWCVFEVRLFSKWRICSSAAVGATSYDLHLNLVYEFQGDYAHHRGKKSFAYFDVFAGDKKNRSGILSWKTLSLSLTFFVVHLMSTSIM